LVPIHTHAIGSDSKDDRVLVEVICRSTFLVLLLIP